MKIEWEGIQIKMNNPDVNQDLRPDYSGWLGQTIVWTDTNLIQNFLGERGESPKIMGVCTKVLEDGIELDGGPGGLSFTMEGRLLDDYIVVPAIVSKTVLTSRFPFFKKVEVRNPYLDRIEKYQQERN